MSEVPLYQDGSHLTLEPEPCLAGATRKVDVRLPGKGDSNSHGARPVHLIITMIKWIRTSRLSIKNSLWQVLSGLLIALAALEEHSSSSLLSLQDLEGP